MTDLYLRFDTEADANAVLFDGEVQRYMNTDVIGIIYKPTGETIETDEGPMPVMAPLDGWHVNIRPMPGEDVEALEPFEVHPAQPVRVWS